MKDFYLTTVLLVLTIIATACQPATGVAAEEDVPNVLPESTPISLPTETTAPTTTTMPEQPTLENSQRPPAGAEREFTTDFSIASIDFAEVLSGGPPKNGIPAILNPKFIAIEEANDWLRPVEPVVAVELNGEVKAYPLQILMWHEIVNDSIGGVPLLVTFCPLCNTAIAFERTVNGEVFDFGTTGRLRFSNLIMYDRQTETWWQQAEGLAIVGELTGTQLVFVPAAIIAWEEFKTAYPNGLVLSRDTGFNKYYGQNPYSGYDDVNRPPFLYQGPATPDQLPPVARVLAVEVGEEAVAYPYDVLSEVRVVNDRVGDQDVAVFWFPGTASALDTLQIADGKDVGTAVAFSPVLDDTILTFQFNGQDIVDEQTGSSWNVLGKAISGEFVGLQLEQVVSVNHFWFSWVAFKPDTRIYQN